MDRQQTYLRSIRETYPDLKIGAVVFNDQGQNNDVLVVDDTFIFRFPKYDHVIAQLQVETAILRGVQGRVPLEVPNPVYVQLEDVVVGTAFVGYRKVPGEPLWRDTFRAIESEEVRDSLAVQLGGFLKALHTVPAQDAIGCELPVSDTVEEWVDIYGRMQEKLFEHMRPEARERVINHFERFLGDGSRLAHEPVLKHGDFGPSNILFDREQGAVTGIIDFGNAGLGDPAYDFAGLLSGYGEQFVRQCGKAYPEVESFLDRVRFYKGTFALLEALFGVENGDEAAFEAGIAQYR